MCICVYVVFMWIHNLTIRQKSVLIALKMIPFASLNVILFVCRFLFFFAFSRRTWIRHTNKPNKTWTEHVSHLIYLYRMCTSSKEKLKRVEIMTDFHELSIHNDINLDAMYIKCVECFYGDIKCMLVLLTCRCRYVGVRVYVFFSIK